MLFEIQSSTLLQVLAARTKHDVFDRVAQANFVERSSVTVNDREQDANHYFGLRIRTNKLRRSVKNGTDEIQTIANSEQRLHRMGNTYVEISASR